MEYVLGIDSGGTHFRIRAAGLDGSLLCQYTGAPASHYTLEREELLRRVGHHIDQCLLGFGGERKNCRALLGGTTGVDSAEDEELLHGIYRSLPGFACPVKMMGDAQLAHYAVTGGVGVLVISGTGSIAFGRNKAGETGRLGGWLFSIMAEEGSGNWLARRSLRHLAAWMDGVVPDGPLARMVREELGITTRKQLNTLAVQIATPPWQEPKLGPVIDKAAEMGDPHAQGLLTEAAGETFKLARDMARVLGMEQDPDLKIGLWGSNVLKSRLHLDTVRRLVKENLPQAEILLPAKTAVEGAVELALGLARG